MGVVAGLIAVVASGLAGPRSRPASAPASKPAVTFTVASYNINYGNPDLPSVVKTLRKANADLVCLQETNRKSARYLRAKLAGLYRHIGFRHAGGAGGFGFLAKKPIKAVKFIPRKFGYFGAWVVRARLGGRNVHVANVHLVPIVPRRNEGLAGLIALWLRTEGIRGKEIAHICASLPAKGPVLIVGDLNSTSQMQAYRYLTGRKYVDSFASVTPRADKHVTWGWRYRGVDWQFRIDHIFHGPQVKTVASRIVKSNASDHRLLVSTLTWAKRRPPATRSAPAGTRPARRGATGPARGANAP